MKKNHPFREDSVFTLDFHSIRNITCPEDSQNNRKIFIGQCNIDSVIPLPTDENVRNYLVNAEGKKRKSYTSVHKAIRETLVNDPSNFSVLLDSGITIVASDIVIDEKDKKIKLSNASIINGSQTQGVLRDLKQDNHLPSDTHIKCEIIITEDEGLIAEISIARNFQNDVMTVTIAGRLKQFDELERSVQRIIPEVKLRKSESEYPSDDILDTEKLLQVIAALVPEELWPNENEKENPNKVYTYSLKSRCLKEFQNIYTSASRDKANNENSKFVDLYNYYLDIAPYAHSLYVKWKTHPGFLKVKNKSITKNIYGEAEVPDGIVFPIIASLSVFVIKSGKSWKLQIPDALNDHELIAVASNVLKEIADDNPQTMGKNKACYSSLLQITKLYKRFTAKGSDNFSIYV